MDQCVIIIFRKPVSRARLYRSPPPPRTGHAAAKTSGNRPGDAASRDLCKNTPSLLKKENRRNERRGRRCSSSAAGRCVRAVSARAAYFAG